MPVERMNGDDMELMMAAPAFTELATLDRRGNGRPHRHLCQLTRARLQRRVPAGTYWATLVEVLWDVSVFA